jgi:hypothetical protein
LGGVTMCVGKIISDTSWGGAQTKAAGLPNSCHVWTTPALQGIFRRVTGVGCSHVYGLFAEHGSWP